MIYSELPKPGPRYKTRKKKFVAVITPDRMVINERAMAAVMLMGAAIALIAWLIRKE